MRRWLISSKKPSKCFVINDSFIVFCYRPKNVVDAVQSKCNLNQIGSLRRKMTTIGNRHAGIWARHARHCRVCRDVTWRAKWNFGYNTLPTITPQLLPLSNKRNFSSLSLVSASSPSISHWLSCIFTANSCACQCNARKLRRWPV